MSAATATPGTRMTAWARRSKSPKAMVADPDLRARRFMVFAIGLAQAANNLSLKPMIAIGGIVALIACLLLRQPQIGRAHV